MACTNRTCLEHKDETHVINAYPVATSNSIITYQFILSREVNPSTNEQGVFDCCPQ